MSLRYGELTFADFTPDGGYRSATAGTTCSLSAEQKRFTKLTAPSRAFATLPGAYSGSACSTTRRKMFKTAVTVRRSCRRKYRKRFGSDNTHWRTVSFRQGCVTADSPDRVGRLSGQEGLSGT